LAQIKTFPSETSVLHTERSQRKVVEPKMRRLKLRSVVNWQETLK